MGSWMTDVDLDEQPRTAPTTNAEDSAAVHGASPAHGVGVPRHGRTRRTGARRTALAAGAVLVAAVVAITVTTSGGNGMDPSGETMPAAAPAGWQRVFSEDFSQSTAGGGFEADYGDRFSVYHGFADTAGTGRYMSSVLSAHDGMLDMHLRTNSSGTPLAGAVVPLVDGTWGGQTSGRYSMRMRSDEVDGYGVAALLWSDDNLWSDGEVDFPEGALGAPAWVNVHCLADPSQKCVHHQTGAELKDWHTYTIEWTPERMSFLIDGRTVQTTTQDIPTARMHLVIQAGSNDGNPPRDAEGSLFVDWITIDVPR